MINSLDKQITYQSVIRPRFDQHSANSQNNHFSLVIFLKPNYSMDFLYEPFQNFDYHLTNLHAI